MGTSDGWRRDESYRRGDRRTLGGERSGGADPAALARHRLRGGGGVRGSERTAVAGSASEGVVERSPDGAVLVPHAGSDAGTTAARLQPRHDQRNPLFGRIHAPDLLDERS